MDAVVNVRRELALNSWQMDGWMDARCRMMDSVVIDDRVHAFKETLQTQGRRETYFVPPATLP